MSDARSSRTSALALCRSDKEKIQAQRDAEESAANLEVESKQRQDIERMMKRVGEPAGTRAIALRKAV